MWFFVEINISKPANTEYGELTGLGNLPLESIHRVLSLSGFTGTVRDLKQEFPRLEKADTARGAACSCAITCSGTEFQFGRQQSAPGRSYCRSSGVKFPFSYRK